GVELVNQSIGEGLGRQYVTRYFPPASKARIEGLVHSIAAAYAHELDTLDWMGPETRRKAQEKLLKLRIKVGYPERWRDYGALVIAGDDLVGNVMRARSFDYQRRIDRLGQPVDRDEWGNEDSPQNVDGSYYAEQNQIVLSAALLQPPYFNAQADDAANYGAIGGFIGHEISHGFDNEGSQFDADGNLLGQPGWFTPEDQARFNARTSALAQQYDAFEPMPGIHMNGELTLSENLADNAGVAIAYKAWRASLNGRPVATMDGLDGDQRFFIAWAQMWRGKMRDDQEILFLKTEGHAPDAIRGFAPLQNMDAFYKAFGIQPGDRMYLPPERRITVW
ncbi:MAG: peptidase, partial [Nevskia sp.]|nr:peptidase [Nevskia sp.]